MKYLLIILSLLISSCLDFSKDCYKSGAEYTRTYTYVNDTLVHADTTKKPTTVTCDRVYQCIIDLNIDTIPNNTDSTSYTVIVNFKRFCK